jgi:hypothetical protein
MKYELLWPLIEKINETHCTYKNLDAVMELRMSLINHIAHMEMFDNYAPAWGLYPED